MTKVFGIHQITLRPGVKIEAFNAFLKRATAFVAPWPGVKTYLLLGDRGDQVGSLIMLMEFESVTARNHYFPAHGHLAAATEQRFAAMSDFIAEWQTLAAFPSEGVPGTDYVELGAY